MDKKTEQTWCTIVGPSNGSAVITAAAALADPWVVIGR